MDVIFHGHAFVEIENLDHSILIDPFITGNTLCDVTLDEICEKNIKAILVTHGHSDHIWDTVEIAKKTGAKVISTFEVIQYFMKYHNLTSVHSMHIGGRFKFENFAVKFVNAVHGGAIWPEMLPGKAAWVIVEINWKKIYHAGDTALHYDMKLLEEENIDIAFLPIGDNFTMWIKDALKAVEFVKPKIVVPMHYDTFDVIKSDPIKFARLVTLSNISTCKVLNPGQAVVLN